MIKDVDRISVGGINGVKVRQLDYTASTIDSPGQLSATFVSETNTLIPPRLSYTSPSLITIGDINLKMFPVSQRRVNSAQGENLLEVKYVDGSFVLDKYFVGLKSKHHEYAGLKNFRFQGRVRGYAQYNEHPTIPVGQIPNSLIILGNYIDPCKDNTFNKKTLRDSCSPCDSSFDEGDIDCVKMRSMTILDVEYSFSDLINGIKSKGIRIRVQAQHNNRYKASYIGPLRSVLQSWCSDFGFSYIFNSFGGVGEIIVYDLSSGVKINNKGLSSSCSTVSFTNEESIEHTVSNGIISHYAVPGGAREINCQGTFGARLVLRPLTLRDLVGQQEWEYQKGGPLYGTTSLKSDNIANYDAMEMACLLAAYSTNLRDAVCWFDFYNIRTVDDAEKCSKSSSTVNGVQGLPFKRGGYLSTNYGDDVQGKYTLPLLGMTIKKVFKKDSVDYKMIESVAGKDLKAILDEKEKAISALGGVSKPYFFIASLPEEGENTTARNNKWEEEIGRNFLGKYFIRKFDFNVLSAPSMVGSGGDDIKFYKQGTDALAFSDLFPYNGGNSYIEELEDKGKAKDSFILATRNPQPTPPLGGVAEYEDLIKKASAFLPVRLNNVMSYSPTLEFDNPHSYFQQKQDSNSKEWLGQDYLFLGFELPNGLHTEKPSRGEHPTEKKFKTKIDGYVQEVPLGLKEVKSSYFTVAGKRFWFPPQATVRESQLDGGAGGYHVFYRNEFNSNTVFFHPKMELVVSNIPNADNVARVNVNMREFDNTSLNDFTISPQTSSCTPNENAIRQSMSDYVFNMSSIHSGPHKSESFEVEGLPSQTFSVLDGLQSLNVRVSSDAVKTFLNFSDFKDNMIEKNDSFKEYELQEKAAYLGEKYHRQYVNIPTLKDAQQIRTT